VFWAYWIKYGPEFAQIGLPSVKFGGSNCPFWHDCQFSPWLTPGWLDPSNQCDILGDDAEKTKENKRFRRFINYSVWMVFAP